VKTEQPLNLFPDFDRNEELRVKYVLDLHREQEERTKSLRLWNEIIKFVEIVLPFFMGALAAGMLLTEILSSK